MKHEIEAAAQFLTQKIFSVETQQNHHESQVFFTILCQILAKKYSSHWYEDKPIKGQAYRSILVDCENNFFDQVVLATARKANIKNVEKRLKTVFSAGFQMWVDPGEVELEYLSPSSATSPTSPFPYKSSKSNEILYRNREMMSQRIIARPPSPPSPSSSPSPSISFPISSSPPSSPLPSSYIFSPSSPLPQISSNPKLSPFVRQIKPIKISQRQNDNNNNIMENEFNKIFDKSLNENDVKDVNSIVLNEHNNLSNEDIINNVKIAYAVPQHAM